MKLLKTGRVAGCDWTANGRRSRQTAAEACATGLPRRCVAKDRQECRSLPNRLSPVGTKRVDPARLSLRLSSHDSLDLVGIFRKR